MTARSPTARQQYILRLLQEQGEILVADLPEPLGVTSMTVWRDLRALEEQGLLRREHGRVLAPGDSSRELTFEAKDPQRMEAKQRIARAAAKAFLRDGDVIVLEGGTTVAALVDELPEQRLSVVTNSLPIGQRLRVRRPSLPVEMLGGWLSPVSGNTTGPNTLREVGRHHFTTCFLSATAWDPVQGPMDPNPLEIEVKRAMAAQADRVVLLLDHAKFGKTSTSVMIHPRRLHAVVTDQTPPPEVCGILKGYGVQIIKLSM